MWRPWWRPVRGRWRRLSRVQPQASWVAVWPAAELPAVADGDAAAPELAPVLAPVLGPVLLPPPAAVAPELAPPDGLDGELALAVGVAGARSWSFWSFPNSALAACW